MIAVCMRTYSVEGDRYTRAPDMLGIVFNAIDRSGGQGSSNGDLEARVRNRIVIR